MSSVTNEAPSSRALRHLNNRNNMAGLNLQKYLQQVEREKNFYMSDLDKDRLDVADFLKNLHKCESDDLPQSKLVREQMYSEDDLSDDGSNIRSRRDTHTAKTIPPRSRRRRRRHDLDDDDCHSLDDHRISRQTKAGGRTRREMLSRRHKEDERAKISDFDKAELFLSNLREDIAKEHMEDLKKQVTRKEFTAYLLRKIRGNESWKMRDGEEEEEQERWAGSRMDMVFPIRRLGNVTAKFKQQDSERNTPIHDYEKRSSFFTRRVHDARREVVSRNSSPQKHPRQRSVFEITEDDPPASALPRPACMPDANRGRRDLLADTARAFGFGEAALVPITSTKPEKSSPLLQDRTPTPANQQFNPLSRASIAERRRLERQAKMKLPVHLKLRSKQSPSMKDDSAKGTDMLRALMKMKSHLRHTPLDDRIKEFMRDLDDLERNLQNPQRPESELE